MGKSHGKNDGTPSSINALLMGITGMTNSLGKCLPMVNGYFFCMKRQLAGGCSWRHQFQEGSSHPERPKQLPGFYSNSYDIVIHSRTILYSNIIYDIKCLI